MLIKYFKDYIDSINEGLIKTYDPNLILKSIIDSLKLMSLDVSGTIDNNSIYLTINDFRYIPLNQIENVLDHITSYVINRGGYYASNIEITNIYDRIKNEKFNIYELIKDHEYYKQITIKFESKFDDLELDIPDKLYHLTIKEYSRLIRRNGLIPRSKSKKTSHLDRIYVCKSIQDCEYLIPQMMFYYTGEKDINVYKYAKKLFKKDITPIIYEIDNSDYFITKLYKDPNYNGGYYILDNVLPSRLQEIKI